LLETLGLLGSSARYLSTVSKVLVLTCLHPHLLGSANFSQSAYKLRNSAATVCR